MTETERRLYRLLLLGDVAMIIASMVAGPIGHTNVAIGTAASAVLISLCLLGYGLYFWHKNR